MASTKITFGTADEKTTYVSAGIVNNGKKFSTLINFSSKNKVKMNEQDFGF